MPTQVGTARQCLTAEASSALDEAVSVARSRSHAQTTSLHLVSALLNLPTSTLRESCSRARSTSYSPRLQFRALDLSISVSLDRLPSSKTPEPDPPISNSLMAAIKRSQANQRRNPETFHIYQQQLQSLNLSISTVKVELKYFILSVLDDPIVSRVFGEAGFRSCDIKLAIINPPRVSRLRCPPPLFLCNLPDDDNNNPGVNRSGLSFPFAGFLGGSGFGDENCRRIGGVLVNKKGKNPLLIGDCAKDAVNSFKECVERRKTGVLPAEIDGVSVVCIEKEVLKFVCEGGSEEIMCLKFEEVGAIVGKCTGSGVVVNYGDLKVFVEGGGSVEAVKYVVEKLSGLVEVHRGKLWLIGVARSCQTYTKFLDQFPSVEKDWDLNLLPITTSFGGLSSKSSLMGSFVPFGGFFPTPSEYENLLNSTNQSAKRCDVCNEKYDQEVSALLNGRSTASVADQHSKNVSSWLLMAERDTCKKVDAIEAKDDKTVLNARQMGLQRKWNDICQRLHSTRSIQRDISQVRSRVTGIDGFQFVVDKKKSHGNDSSPNESRCTNLSSFMPMDMQKISLLKQKTPIPVAFEAENFNFQTKIPVEDLRLQQRERENHWLPSQPLQSSRTYTEQISPSCDTSVTTNLGLGTLYASAMQEPGKPILQDYKDRLQYFSGTVSAECERNSENAANHIAQQSSCSGLELGWQLDAKDLKYLGTVLAESVPWQDDAIYTISRTLSLWRNGCSARRASNNRGDIWLGFLGHDKVGKRKIAAALAEIIFRSKESLISVDLSSEDGISHSNSIFDRHNLNNYEVKFRGKTVVDHIAEELRKKPCSVVLLENIDKADFPAQNSLSQAIRTGRFPDSHGREISIKNMIFVTTTSTMNVNKNSLTGKGIPEFSEERILRAKGLQMQILLSCVAGDSTRTNDSNVEVKPRKSSSVLVNKRKLIDLSGSTSQDKTFETTKRAHKSSNSWLDLNLPVEELEDDDNGNCDSDLDSDNSETWLEDFLDQVDEKVVFKPFDFDALAEKVLKEISLKFQKTVRANVVLEIDPEVIVQILAAAWLTDGKRAVEDWIEQVLCRSIVEAQQRWQLLPAAHSTVTLITCEGLPLEEQAPGICLPSRIILN